MMNDIKSLANSGHDALIIGGMSCTVVRSEKWVDTLVRADEREKESKTGPTLKEESRQGTVRIE